MGQVYLYFKRELAALFGIKHAEVSEHDDMKFSLETWTALDDEFDSLPVSGPVYGIIQDNELQNLFEKYIEFDSTEIALFTNGKSYECAVEFQGYNSAVRLDRINGISEVSDDKSRIIYSVGLCTAEYCLFLLIQYAKHRVEGGLSEDRILGKLPWRLRHNRPRPLRVTEASIPSTWLEIVPLLLELYSIKIESINYIKKNEIERRATSFEFQIMYSTGLPIRRYQSQYGLFFRNRIMRSRIGDRKAELAPKRRYDEEAVDYFRAALSSDDPYVRYISFYHVLEFYFSRSFRKAVSQELSSRITRIDFSLDDDKLFDIAANISKMMGSREQLGYSGEKEELKYVLLDYVSDIEYLKKTIQYHDADALTYYATNKVSFVQNTPLINWEKEDDLHRLIASRIYQTRNALVHSKNRKDGSRYHPYNDASSLQKELPLIWSLAEIVIDEAGVPY